MADIAAATSFVEKEAILKSSKVQPPLPQTFFKYTFLRLVLGRIKTDLCEYILISASYFRGLQDYPSIVPGPCRQAAKVQALIDALDPGSRPKFVRTQSSGSGFK